MAETLLTTAVDLQTDEIRLIWEVCGWRLSRCFHGSNERPLISNTFSTQNCKWQMSLQFQFNHGPVKSEVADHLKVGLSLIDCDCHPSSVVVNGTLQIISPSGHPYISKDLTGSMSVGEAKVSALKNASAFPDTLKIVAQLSVYIGGGMIHTQQEGPKKVIEADDISSQAEILSDNFEALMYDKAETDVTFVVQNQEFEGHRAIFAARSPYFHNHFKSYRRKGRPQVEIEDCTPETWEIFRHFVYTGKLNISLADNVPIWSNLLKLSEKFGMDYLTKLVLSHLESNVDEENVLKILEIAFQFDLIRLKELSMRFVKTNLEYFKNDGLDDLLNSMETSPELVSAIIDCL